jgi:hypothetical protein
MKVVELNVVEHNEINEVAVQEVEGLLERLKSGDSTAVGVVEVKRGNYVATFYVAGRHYHELNSGAARLANRIAREE